MSSSAAAAATAELRRKASDEDDAPIAALKRRRASAEEPADAVNGLASGPPPKGADESGRGASGPSKPSGTADDKSDSGSDVDVDDFMPDLSRVLSDSDSSSSSSSDDEGAARAPPASASVGARAPEPAAGDADSGAKEGEPAAAAAVTSVVAAGGEQGPAAAAPAPPSPSSESSSSSSSSESESESEGEASVRRSPVELPGAAEEQQIVEINQYDAVRRAILKRDDLARILNGLPLEAAEEAVIRCYVRLAVQAAQTEQNNAACVLAEVIAIEPSPPYAVALSDGQRITLKLRLRCKRGSSHRLVKISSVSNQDLTESEHEQWAKLVERTGVEPKMFTEQMIQKADDISKARNFKFDDPIVSQMLRKKGNLEFDAQKESRMRFLVQCAMSQMDISGIRDSEARELEERYKDSLHGLRMQEAKSTELQAQWFDKRANLFSLKMINKKNYERQVRDDRHALDYTLATETAGTEGLNPFQRRACRPLVAWDTDLTAVDGLPTNVKDKDEEAAPDKPAEAKAAPPEQTPDGSAARNPEGGDAPMSERQQMERFVRAHSGARHILAGLGGRRS